MGMFRLLSRVFVLAVAGVWLAAAASSVAWSEPASDTPPPVDVKVGIVLLNVGRLDLNTGTYTMDFYLVFSCDQPCDPERFEFTNGRPMSIKKQDDTPTLKIFRVQAAFNENLPLHEYPFDKHTLTIALEDELLGSAQLRYAVDRDGTAIDRDVIIAGWDLDPNWDARVEEHYYEAFKQSFSRYIFTIRIQKPPLSVILKVMVPALAMLFTGFLALLIQTEESKASRVVNRITISTSALTATILFYVNLTTSIPPVGYLTFADRFMIINIVALSGVVASSAMLLLLEDRAEDATIHRWHRVFMGLVPASWVGMQAVNWLAR